MTTSSGFYNKTVEVGNRSFLLQVVYFDNGNFISVTEGAKKLGSMVVSLSTGSTPVTTTVIPAKTEYLFLKLISERISTTIKGICIVSAFVQKELDPDTAKTLLSEISEMVTNV